jgi:hypothetical protein
MMRTRTIATGAGITGSADCPPAFRRSSSLGPLGLWCCAVSSPVAAPGLTRTYMPTAYSRRLHSMPHSPPHTHSLLSLTHPMAHLLRPGAGGGCKPAEFKIFNMAILTPQGDTREDPP